jgi:DNA-binding GntR family transcriptional regulator
VLLRCLGARRGIYIVRKSKREMIEMIQVWAALESMAARLATPHAPDAKIAELRHLFDEFQNSPPAERLDEYSDANIAFHTAVIALGGSRTIIDATRNLLMHTSTDTAISWVNCPNRAIRCCAAPSQSR